MGSHYNNIEIKMALRSIEKYIIGYRKVIVISPKIPDFLVKSSRLELIQKKEDRCPAQSRVQRKIEWALKNLDVTNEFAYWNDDFLILQQFNITRMPNYVSGKITLSDKETSGWQETKRRTGQILAKNNKPLYNYDIHVPIIFDKEKHLSLSEWWHQPNHNIPLMRSIYGNYFCGQNETLRDVKLQQKWKNAINNILESQRWIISYGDGALDAGFGKWMENQFPNRSIFEKPEGCNDCDKKVAQNESLEIWKKLHKEKVS